ncbi:hypothetical protein [Neisseria sp.]|uniref:hypothetical protein n=1 Tax=Neisseria sp. TaxID=192066 RepID=UPI0035A156D2
MKFKFLVIGVLGVILTSFSYANQKYKKSFEHQEKFILYKVADLNNDGRKDVIAVTEHAASNVQYGNIRTLIIFLRNKNNKLDEILRNPNVIACSKCSNFESEPDPFAEKRISVKNGKISIVQNFDIRFYPSIAIYSFKYQPNTGHFMTKSAKHILYELAEDGKYKKHVSNHILKFGKRLDIFNPDWPSLIGIQDKFY